MRREHGVLMMSDVYQKGGFKAAKAKATAVIDGAYAYQYGPVTFKPTYTRGKQPSARLAKEHLPIL